MSAPQAWNPKQYADHARFVTDLGAPLIALLAPKPGERILDLGCGDGVLTKQLMDLGCEVLGVDASSAMVEAAQALGVPAQVMDGHELPFHEQFDAVFSNAALHWMLEPDEVLRRIRRSLRPGGRLVAELGGQGNLTRVLIGLHQVLKRQGYDPDSIRPWYFPSAEEYRERLTRQDFEVRSLELFPRPTPLPEDITDWLEMFAQPFLTMVPRDSREQVLREIRESLAPTLQSADGRWVVDYVRLRCEAIKPASSTGVGVLT
ncbi:MAG: methyltransferase domain-containing protein [Nitrospiraceae bacterium]|jgi:trans-aconitate methyltransferase